MPCAELPVRVLEHTTRSVACGLRHRPGHQVPDTADDPNWPGHPDFDGDVPNAIQGLHDIVDELKLLKRMRPSVAGFGEALIPSGITLGPNLRLNRQSERHIEI